MSHDAQTNEQEGGPVKVPEKVAEVPGEPAPGAGGEAAPHPAFVREVMNRYWQMMPDEMKKLFHTDTLFNQIITRSAMALLSNENMLLNLCSALYQTCAELQGIVMNVARKNGTEKLIITP